MKGREVLPPKWIPGGTMLWYVAFNKEPGIHQVLDDPDLLLPRSLGDVKVGTGLPSDAEQWDLPRLEAEERKAEQKVIGLQDEISSRLEYLRDNPLRYKALQELLKRFERRLKRLGELKARAKVR